MNNLYLQLYRLYWYLRLIVSQLIYRPFFGSFGSHSALEPPTAIANPKCIFIGDRVRIRRGVKLEAVKAHGRIPSIVIGDRCNIEQNVHIVGHSRIEIGNDVCITANCAIVDVTHAYDGVCANIAANIHNDDSFVRIGDGTFVGIGCVILPNVEVGAHSVVGANSVVTRSFPAGSVIAGSPATLIRTVERATKVDECHAG